jgi:hypothetical protein
LEVNGAKGAAGAGKGSFLFAISLVTIGCWCGCTEAGEVVFGPCFADEFEGESLGDTAGEGGARLSFVDVGVVSL